MTAGVPDPAVAPWVPLPAAIPEAAIPEAASDPLPDIPKMTGQPIKKNLSILLFVQLVLIDYLCRSIEKPARTQDIRTIYRTPEFDAFYYALPLRVRNKFEYVFEVVQSVYNISTKFIKHLEKSDLYEMRVSIGSNEYRTILFRHRP